MSDRTPESLSLPDAPDLDWLRKQAKRRLQRLVVRLLLEAGADPAVRDSKHDGDAVGWAEYGRTPRAVRWHEVVEAIAAHTTQE